MRPVFLRPTNGFLQDRMGEPALDQNRDGLFVLVAGYRSLQNALWHSWFYLFYRRRGFFVEYRHHARGVPSD